MLLWGNPQNITGEYVFNVTSMCEGYRRLNLIPPNSLGLFMDRDFDIAYALYILNNDWIFFDFFSIIYLLYLEKGDVYLIFSDENWSINLAESLLKLIQQRYGYNGFRIDNMEDLFAANNIQVGFNTSYGLANLDEDKARYGFLEESLRIRNGGRPYYEIAE